MNKKRKKQKRNKNNHFLWFVCCFSCHRNKQMKKCAHMTKKKKENETNGDARTERKLCKNNNRMWRQCCLPLHIRNWKETMKLLLFFATAIKTITHSEHDLFVTCRLLAACSSSFATVNSSFSEISLRLPPRICLLSILCWFFFAFQWKRNVSFLRN